MDIPLPRDQQNCVEQRAKHDELKREVLLGVDDVIFARFAPLDTKR